MKIQTKFNPGDYIWIMYEDNPIRVCVNYIDIRCAKSFMGDKYAFSINYFARVSSWPFKDPKVIIETGCFATKEELIASL